MKIKCFRISEIHRGLKGISLVRCSFQLPPISFCIQIDSNRNICSLRNASRAVQCMEINERQDRKREMQESGGRCKLIWLQPPDQEMHTGGAMIGDITLN